MTPMLGPHEEEEAFMVTTVAAAGSGIMERLARRGISRRAFMKYCSGLAAVLALPPRFAHQIAQALTSTEKPGLVWLEFQDCAGNTESFLRSRNPSVADVILDLVSVDYHETIMAAAGDAAEASKEATIGRGGHLVVVEGSIPTRDGGIYCTIAGKTARQHLREAAEGAAAIISVGSCASFGGIPAADPNPTGAVSVGSLVSGVPVINLPGCPANADNITATLAHFLTFGALPATDGEGRPLFAYGKRIHDNCERRAHFDAGQFVEDWGDEAHRKGWCLYKMGCKGPSTFHNCGSLKWNEGTNWPIGIGHGCVGCSEAGFWDTMTPFYDRLPSVAGFDVRTSADRVGIGVAVGSAALFGIHGVAKAVQGRRHAAASAGETTSTAESAEDGEES
jgi:hydrogenase small subunit